MSQRIKTLNWNWDRMGAGDVDGEVEEEVREEQGFAEEGSKGLHDLDVNEPLRHLPT